MLRSGLSQYVSLLSPAYIVAATPICFMLLWHCAALALSLALAKAGRSSAARIAMMAMTTSNSIKVNALARTGRTVSCFGHTTVRRVMTESKWRIGLLEQPYCFTLKNVAPVGDVITCGCAASVTTDHPPVTLGALS